MTTLSDLHFIRPLWLLALAGLPLLAWWLARRRASTRDWSSVVDPHLLPHLVSGGKGRRTHAMLVGAVAWVLTVVALAGPSWRQVEQPLWQTRSPLVLAVDLSSAALATDLAPNRLAQVRARLDALMRERGDGPIGLVAFAGDAFTVAPVTDDAANVALFLDALHPDVMPIDGQAVDRAIVWSRGLIERAGFPRGHIVVMTDHADAAALRAAAAARNAGVTISVVGVGSARGAGVSTLQGGLARVRLDEDSLRELAARGGGRYARLSIEGGDAAVFARSDTASSDVRKGGRTWSDEGFRLLPFVMILALLWWLRRTPPVLLLLVALALPSRAPAADLWRRPDQRDHAELRAGIEAYRKKQHRAAAERFARVDSAVAHYNRGNALAKAGSLEEAVAAYDRALQRQPGMADAIANRRAVLEAMARRQGGRGGQGKPSSSPGSQGQPRPCPPGDPRCSGKESSPKPADAPAAPGKGQGKPDARAQAEHQQRVDAAQRERMQRALRNAKQRPAGTPPPTPAQQARRRANDAALQRVPDQPGSLLREKFLLEYERRQGGSGA